MQETKTLFPQDIYTRHLSNINNIHFTAREIDVIACLLNGRKTSKTAFFLSIAPRTVETHIHNVMSKLGCNTREAIIDFIETTDRLPFLRKYYSLLRINVLFEKSLKDISKISKNIPLRCFFIGESAKDPFIEYLKSHLKLAGIAVSQTARKKEEDHGILVLPEVFADKDALLLQKILQGPNKILFIHQKGKNYQETSKKLINADVVDFAKQENYYLAFFCILKKLFPNLNLEKIVTDFKDKYKKTPIEPKSFGVSAKDKDLENYPIFSTKSKFSLIPLAIIGFLGIGVLLFHWNQRDRSHPFRSDLIIPKESVLLNRPTLIAEIDNKLNKEKGLQTIALIGSGGAGKTTLARQYANYKKTESIWELNAETRESLINSFKNLAYTLAETKEKKEELSFIQNIQNAEEKEKQILSFVKRNLKDKGRWILIYDNLETISKIKDYFPQDPQVWGIGKVIITTRDSNIKNTNSIKTFIHIEELSQLESLTLFSKILYDCEPNELSPTKKKEAIAFLKSIPSFPLDVSVAAYYIKSTHISYEKYLELINQFKQNFDTSQVNLLTEISSYQKTRYGIVSLSFKKLINTDPNFKDLLFVICLLDSQNIPINLLEEYQDSATANSFLHNLRKYSLITSEVSIGEKNPIHIFNLHRSTQWFGMIFVLSTLNEKEKSKIKILKKTILTIKNIYPLQNKNSNDYELVRILLPQLETLLMHIREYPNQVDTVELLIYIADAYRKIGDYYKSKSFLEEALKISKNIYSIRDIRISNILQSLGEVTVSLGNHKQAKTLLEEALTIQENYYNTRNHIKIAFTLRHLGMATLWSGDYHKGKTLLEKALNIEKRYYGICTHIEMALTLRRLGIAYLSLGDYHKAKTVLEEALNIQENYYNNHKHIEIALTQRWLGIAYLSLGDYNKARTLLEEILSVQENYYGNRRHIEISFILRDLGRVYLKLKDYNKAKRLLEDTLVIQENYYSTRKHFNITFTLKHLGIVYRNLGDFDRAKAMLEEALSIQENYYSNRKHIQIAFTLIELGKLYLSLKNYIKAKALFEEALDIQENYYGKHNHIELSFTLRSLGEAYLKLRNYKEAKALFEEALIIQESFYGNRKHIETILILENLRHLIKG